MNFLQLNTSGDVTERAAINTSAGAGDANKVVETDSSGKIHISLLPNGVGADANSIIASEAIAAGDFVNIFDNSGTPTVRRADATAVGKQAHGYVLSAVASGQQATVFYDDSNSSVTGLTAGVVYFLSDSNPGKTTTAPPAGTGKIVQRLGMATAATAIHVNLDKPIIRA